MQVQGLWPDALHGDRLELHGAWGGVRDEALEGAWLALHGLSEQSLESRPRCRALRRLKRKTNSLR